MTGRNLILLGPPGAGKGTQAARLRDEFALRYLSTGQLLRQHRADGTDLGRQAAEYMDDGRLVPDDLVNAMLIDAAEDGPAEGLLFDGFPRTVAQAEALDTALASAEAKVDAVLLLEVPDAVIVERISGRLTCPQGHVFHLRSAPPAQMGVCDHDGEVLTQRDDDRPETVRRRLTVYRQETAPLVTRYKQRRILHRIDGVQPVNDVFEAMRTALALGRTMSRGGA